MTTPAGRNRPTASKLWIDRLHNPRVHHWTLTTTKVDPSFDEFVLIALTRGGRRSDHTPIRSLFLHIGVKTYGVSIREAKERRHLRSVS